MFAVSHSVICSAALTDYIASIYDIESIVTCRLIQRRISDTYIIECADTRYVLRIYRHQWRTLIQIQSEMDILDHLRENNCDVPEYKKDRNANTIQCLSAPEGERYAVLFEFKHGNTMSHNDSLVKIRAFGRSAATIHQCLDIISYKKLERFELNIDWMLTQPLNALEPYLLNNYPKYVKDFQRYTIWLKQFLNQQKLSASQYGLIHGDLLPANAICMGDSEKIAVIDFDFCGYGLRAYDIAVFIHDNTLLNGDNGFAKSFLQGYETVRAIDDTEWACVEALLPVRGIWFLGLWAANAHDWSDEYLRDAPAIKRQLNYTRQLIHKLLIRADDR